jgi:hypothetical protein
MSIEQITDEAGLASLLADARGEGRCALDTEFVWERTYAPVLCLVQIATAITTQIAHAGRSMHVAYARPGSCACRGARYRAAR